MTVDTWVLLGVALALVMDSLLTTLATRDAREREARSRAEVRKAMAHWERDSANVIASLRRLETTSMLLLEHFEKSRTPLTIQPNPYASVPHVHQRRSDPLPSAQNGKYHDSQEASVLLDDMDNPQTWREVMLARLERQRLQEEAAAKEVEPLYQNTEQA